MPIVLIALRETAEQCLRAQADQMPRAPLPGDL
jgi:hypothetical protein